MQTHQRTRKPSAISALALEFRVSERRIRTMLQGVGINPSSLQRDDESQAFYREVVASRLNIFTSYGSGDEEYLQTLDEQIRVFDEIYVDTAPIIQKDWFLHFVADSKDILKRRKKRLIILEKTMEELYGLKSNPEKDQDVRIRAIIRPDLIRSLAKQRIVRLGDTGSGGIADDHLVELFRRIGANLNLMLITQDRGLSERIVHLATELGEECEEVKPLTFLEKLIGKKEREVITHRMIACKLIEGGKLKRLYICPECSQSYYDDLYATEGIVLCGRCYIRLREEEERKELANRKRREAQLKAEEERQKKLEAEEERLERERNRLTVEKLIQKRKQLAIFYSSIGVTILLLIIALLVSR
ncbi:MAG: hypothetical protein QM442_04025 [Spirochaetota bacterium]|nr:hypothetical protein [Spirochaetota bacterium]